MHTYVQCGGLKTICNITHLFLLILLEVFFFYCPIGNPASEQVGRENNDPLPNPWAPRPTGGSGGSTAGGGSGPTQTDSTSGDSSTPLTGGPFGKF